MPFNFHKLKQFFMFAKPQNLNDGSLILNPKAAHKYSLIWVTEIITTIRCMVWEILHLDFWISLSKCQ